MFAAMDSNPNAGIVNLSVILLVIKFGFTKTTFSIFLFINFMVLVNISKVNLVKRFIFQPCQHLKVLKYYDFNLKDILPSLIDIFIN